MFINSVDYGTVQEPNLEEITKVVNPLISVAVGNFGYHVKNCTIDPGSVKLSLTPDKPYTARAVVDVIMSHNNTKKKIGDLYVLLFAPGDGTGNENYYKMDKGTFGQSARVVSTNSSLDIPAEYRFSEKPERVLPRNKLAEGVLCEAFLPICSVEGRMLYPYTVSLEQITVDNITHPNVLVPGLKMGVSVERFRPNLCQALLPPPKPQIQLTCGYRRNGERFGDPHATFYNPKLAEGAPNLMQVAGFLSVEDKDNPLCQVLDSVGIVSE